MMTAEEKAAACEAVLDLFYEYEDEPFVEDVLCVLSCVLCGVLRQGTKDDLAKVVTFIITYTKHGQEVIDD